MTEIERIVALELEVSRLHKIFTAEKTPGPMDRGMTFYPAGDSIPRSGAADNWNGNVYLIKDNGKNAPFRFTKNSERRPLLRGEKYLDGVVDTKLRQDEVMPNDFFYLEI